MKTETLENVIRKSKTEKLYNILQDYKGTILRNRIHSILYGTDDPTLQYLVLNKQKILLDNYTKMKSEDKLLFLETFFMDDLLQDTLDLEGR